MSSEAPWLSRGLPARDWVLREGGGTARRAQGTLPARGLGAPGAFGSPWLCHSSLMGTERLIFSSPTG